MRVVIVDDEPLARERLKRLLQEFPGYEVVGEAGDGEKALDVIDDEEPDLVLLDIRMGGMDGLQVARQLAELDVPPAVIFTTAYSEHALSAFDAAAQAYLLKPIRLDKLKEALMRVRKPTRAHKPQPAAAGDAGKPKREFVLATTRDGLVRVPAADIVYFLADQKYTTVRHLHGEVLIEESLKTLETDFAPWFLRIHRKALVATRFIAGLERDRAGEQHHWLKVKHSDQPLPVSRRRLAEVRRFLTDQA
ncbi:MAG TPA: LytTR family DNA-binding domain-containing protein [Solimonas sp.]|nr:LytTR family DNA-binding domain-containing protein [Solimonas sp.]